MLLIMSAGPAYGQEWRVQGAAYFWLAGIEGTTAVAFAEVPTDISVGSILQYVNLAGSGRLEVFGHRWLFSADVFFVDLGETLQIPVVGEVDLTSRQFIGEGTVGYEVSPGLHVLGAVRYYDVSNDLGEKIETEGMNWVDGFVGAEYRADLSARWLISARGDLGAGGSDFSWFGSIGVGYRLGASTALALGYRILSVDYESGTGLKRRKYDIVTNGFAVGLAFGF